MIRIITILLVCLFALANSGVKLYAEVELDQWVEITQLPTSLITFQSTKIKAIFTDAMGNPLGHYIYEE